MAMLCALLCLWQQYHISGIRRRCKHRVQQRPRWQSCGRRGPATSTNQLSSAIKWNTSWVTTTVATTAESGDQDLSLMIPAMHSKWQQFWTSEETHSTSSECCRYCASSNKMSEALSAHRADRLGLSVMVRDVKFVFFFKFELRL